MPSESPQDIAAVMMPPGIASAVYRTPLLLGAFTANTTVTVPGIAFDRRAVIREIWFGADVVGSDGDGTMLVNAKNQDISEGAADSLVASFDSEATIVAAKKAYKATLASETSENERTVEAGDLLYFELVSNSAAIDTNQKVTATVVWQSLAAL